MGGVMRNEWTRAAWLTAALALLVTGKAIATSESLDELSVMLLIDERSLGSISTEEIESLTSALLAENGIRVVDRKMIRSRIEKDKSLLQMAGDSGGAAALGMQFGADIVLNGTAVAKPSARRIAGSNLRSYEAAVTLRAVRTDDARLLATASDTATVVGLEDVSGSIKALRAAGSKSADTIINKMLRAYEDGVGSVSSDRVTLVFGGVDRLWKLKSVRDSLKGCAMLTGLNQDEYTAGTVTFTAECEQDVSLLAEVLVMSAPKDLGIQVLDTADGKITARIVER